MIKSIRTIMKQDKERYKVPRKVQDVIPIRRIWPDGIFQVGSKFTKMYRFTDINYLVASREDKESMFLTYSELLNSLDSGATTKLTIYNHRQNRASFEKSILMPMKEDGLDQYRKEYNQMLLDKATGANGIMQEKYLTVSVARKDVEEARTYFSRIGADLSAHFAALGSKCMELTAAERLRMLHDFYRAGEETTFDFDIKSMARKGHDIRDFICPDSIEKNKDHLILGDQYCRVLFLKDYASYIKDSMVTELTDLNRNMMLSIDILPIPTDEAVHEVESRLLGVETNITNWQRRQNANNNFSAVVPYDMELQRKESKEFLDDLTTRDQRMMFAVLTMVLTADTKEQLDADTETVQAIARKHMCQLAVLKYQQLDGLNTVLPIGSRRIDVFRTLTTESLAVFMPFKVQEIQDKGGIFFGENAISHNLIMCNKANLLNQSAFLLGVPGSGKSFNAKELITFLILNTDDDILICDPEGEYFPLVHALNGQVVKISAKSTDYINPMDVNLDVIYHPEKYRINGDVEDIDTIIADKAEFITSFCEVIMKKPQNAELNGDEVSMIDLCVKDIYKKYLYNDPKPENMPTLQDFYERLNFYAPDKPAAQNIANSLQLYVTGSQNVFNHRSNVDTQNRVVCFDIRELGTTLRKAGMLIVQHMVWTRVSQNRSRRKSTRYYVDEFHLLLNQPQTANYSIEMWKRFRKWGGIITGISQNVTDFLGSLAVESIVGNSDFILMLNQHSGDQKILAEKLNISKHQISFVNNSNAGEGLLFYGNVIIPFADRYPQDTRTYALMSTKPDEIQT